LFFDLQAAIKRFVAQTNDIPKPCVWTPIPTRSSLPSSRVPKVRFAPLALAGDDDGATTWRRIMAAVEQLANKIPPSRVH
jgi:hypothetical protein